MTPPELDHALSEALDDSSTGGEADPGSDGGTDTDNQSPDSAVRESAPPDRLFAAGPQRHAPRIDRPTVASARGRMIRDVPAASAPDTPTAVLATVRDLARRRAGDPAAGIATADFRAALRESRMGRLVILTVDLSGSMGTPARAEAASGTALGLLTEAYEQRHHVALVGFRGDSAEVLLAPTSSVEVARNRVGTLTTGGATPLAEGLHVAIDLAVSRRSSAQVPLVVLLTDGRATGAPDALDRALTTALTAKRYGIEGLVLDCETGATRLGLAARVADAMGAPCLEIGQLEPNEICSIIRRTIAA